MSAWLRFARAGAADGNQAQRAALLAVGLLLPIVPWTIRNADVLGRVVPISTGSGKALYVGTFLPADGEYQRVKAILVERYQGRALDPHSEALEEVDPTPLFDRVAERYPDLPRDSALGKIGKENFSKYFGDDPLGYAGDDRAQGRADVGQWGRRSDEQRRSAARSRSSSWRSAWLVRCCSGCAAAGGIWSRWRPRSCS